MCIKKVITEVKNSNNQELIERHAFSNSEFNISTLLYDSISDKYSSISSFLFDSHSNIVITNNLKVRGMFYPFEDKIEIWPKYRFIHPLYFYKVLAHEVIHSTGIVLDRKMEFNFFDPRSRDTEENIAELGSYLIFEKFNLNNEQTFWSTVKYLKSVGEIESINFSLNEARKAVNHLFSKNIVDKVA